MLESEKLAIAAHLHVLLRRKTGRVTDTEWMACNADYAREIVRFARQRAAEDPAPELAEWADKLERALGAMDAPGSHGAGAALAQAPAPSAPPETPRYVGGIR